MALKDRRQEIIKYVQSNAAFLNINADALNIYEGNLFPYVDAILKSSLSTNYYQAIKDRILPINILQRFINKISNTYSKPPKRKSDIKEEQDFVDYYAQQFDIDQSGQIADAYSNMFKGFAWEPYVDKNKKPALRELPFNSFLVKSDSKTNPEEEDTFIKIMGKLGNNDESVLLFVYTDTEFDAFTMNGNTYDEALKENQGINVIGTIPYIYGKRQKNRLLPVLDSDMLKICKAIPVMLTDAAGAQMFQCFSIIYGVDLNFENATMSPNVIWSLKSDREQEAKPSLGTIKPEADTDKIVQFVTTIFALWIETKGIRVGSIGNIDGANASSGIAKIIDELDVYELQKKSMKWFEKDEKELWNKKLPKIHNYWIKSRMVDASEVPPLTPEGKDFSIKITFEEPKPMKSRSEKITEIKTEVDLGTMTMKQAIMELHPEYTEEVIDDILNNKVIM